MLVFSQVISILSAIIVIFLVQNSVFSSFSSYLLALLIIFTLIYTTLKRRSKSVSTLFSGTPIELFASTSIILLIIELTGNILSPLFFFLYLLLILLIFLAGPISVLIFAIGITLYFFPETLNNPTAENIVKLASFLLIAPIGYFIGKEFEHRKNLDEKIEAKTDEIIQDAENLKEASSFPDEDDALQEIIEEAQSLKKDSEN